MPRVRLPSIKDGSHMISRIVNFALHQKLFVWLGLIIFIAGGLAAFKNLPIEAFPTSRTSRST
jgi:Cu/Ag efflux pump CusA